jgi:hypothetical protein
MPSRPRSAKATKSSRPAPKLKRPAPVKAKPKAAKPKPKVAAKPAKPAKPSKGAAKPKSEPEAPKSEPVIPARFAESRYHVLSLSFVRDGDEFMARLETDAGQITELKNRSLDQLLTLVAGELEDLLE